jgi:hypothetical protein
MTLLLGADQVTLYPAGSAADSHGWALAGTPAAWQGSGSLQTSPGMSADTAAQGGGHGPYDPNATRLATLFLPPDAPVAEGCVADVRGERYHLTQVRLVTDPTGTGGLDCWAASATGTSTWGT